ncbi:uncharacterized protein LOC125027223 isoform X1 [Penaeus chinensis]|uniref:uncharacterized protein LOC125027223 isoform X1 n=2 Tax=Penaeus chinensis TaxID=139456 RepID=UPI001FB7C0D2|nr:uncharacterized protein LOC125027223 isoform X1 [Penaeus chinensis]
MGSHTPHSRRSFRDFIRIRMPSVSTSKETCDPVTCFMANNLRGLHWQLEPEFKVLYFSVRPRGGAREHVYRSVNLCKRSSPHRFWHSMETLRQRHPDAKIILSVHQGKEYFSYYTVYPWRKDLYGHMADLPVSETLDVPQLLDRYSALFSNTPQRKTRKKKRE